MRFVEFYERQSFGHHAKHLVNPEEVAALSSVSNNEETLVRLRDGAQLLVSDRVENVHRKLEADE